MSQENPITIADIVGNVASGDPDSALSHFENTGNGLRTRLESRMVVMDEEELQFAIDALSAMTKVGDFIKNKVNDVDPYYRGVVDWFTDEQHGLRHSFGVVKRARELRDQGDFTEVSDKDLFVRAVLHDMAEFLPWFDEKGKVIEMDSAKKEQASRYHPLIMKQMIDWFGKEFGVGDADNLAIDVMHHDLFMKRPSSGRVKFASGRMTNAGKLIADADRLVEDTEGSIRRNRVGSLGKWYIFRSDLSAKDRLEWSMRTGGLFDGRSALETEFYGNQEWMFTAGGKKAYVARREEFLSELTRFYADEYQAGWTALKHAKSVQVGLRVKNDGVEGIRELDEFDVSRMSGDRNQIIQAMRDLMQTPVSDKKSGKREYYGYSILATMENGETVWLDPSVLAYESVERLIDAINSAANEYLRAIHNKE